jgi:hypothetical protein
MTAVEEVYLPGDEPEREPEPEPRGLEELGQMQQPGARPLNRGWFHCPASGTKFAFYCLCGEWLVGWFSDARWEKLHTAPWRRAHTGDGHELRANAKQAEAARARLAEALAARTSTCRACPAEVLWAKTTNGKSMPFVPQANPDGNVLLAASGGSITAKVLTAGERAAVTCPLYLSHHAECPGAAQFRNPRR